MGNRMGKGTVGMGVVRSSCVRIVEGIKWMTVVMTVSRRYFHSKNKETEREREKGERQAGVVRRGTGMLD